MIVGEKKTTYFFRHAALRREHDARIVRQHVQPLLLGHELVGALLDARQVREVQLQELDTAAVRLGLLHGVDGLGGLIGAAAGDVDGRVGGVQQLDQLEADARVAARDDVDLGRVAVYHWVAVVVVVVGWR